MLSGEIEAMRQKLRSGDYIGKMEIESLKDELNAKKRDL